MPERGRYRLAAKSPTDLTESKVKTGFWGFRNQNAENQRKPKVGFSVFRIAAHKKPKARKPVLQNWKTHIGKRMGF